MKRSRPAPRLKLIIPVLVLGGVAVAAVVFLAPWKSGQAKAVPAASSPAARNELRREQLKLLSDAVHQYIAEVGPLPMTIPNHQVAICANTGAVCKTAGLVDLMYLSSKGYIQAIPSDPVGGNIKYSTGYSFGRDSATGILTFTAPRAENGQTITQTVQ